MAVNKYIRSVCFSLVVLIVGLVESLAQRPGSLDESFTAEAITLDDVRCVLSLADGKVLVGGDFGLIRLLSDGRRDPSFAPPSGPAFSCYGLWSAGDDRVLVTGYIKLQGGQTNLVLLEQDGSVDEIFRPSLDNIANGAVFLPDGKMVVAGAFGKVGGVDARGIVRLNGDGSIDSSFNIDRSRLSGVGNDVCLFRNGDLLVAGLAYRDRDVSRLLNRFKPDGAIDLGFSVGFAGDSAGFFSRKLHRAPDGSIYIQGVFSVARLTPDGVFDPTFKFDAFGTFGPTMLMVQQDGRLVGGGPTPVSESGVPWRLARIDADGVVDTNFVANLAISANGRSISVKAGAILDQHAAVIAGVFDQVDGEERTGIARIFLDDRSGPSVIRWNARQTGFAEHDRKAVLTVLREGGISGPASAVYSIVPGSAQAGVDFEATGGIVRFESGETFKQIEVPLLDNAIPQFDRSFFAELSRPDQAALGQTSSMAVTILDDDSAVGPETTTASRSETAESVSFTLRRSGGLSASTAVRWRVTGGSARPGIDFAPTNGSVVFDAENTVATIRLDLVDNQEVEGARNVVLEISPGEFSSSVPEQRQIALEITDNDIPGFAGDAVTGPVHGLAGLSGGGAVIVGSFKSVHGVPKDGVAFLAGGMRLAEGRDIRAIYRSGQTPAVSSVYADPEGGVFVGGNFTNINGLSRIGVARLDQDGQVDPLFDTESEIKYLPRAFGRFSDGRILIGGTESDFNVGTQTGINTMNRGSISRFSRTGRKDLGFETRATVSGQLILIPLEDGGFIAAGVTVYRDRLSGLPAAVSGNPVVRRNLARFLPDGGLDTNFQAGLVFTSDSLNRSSTFAALWRKPDGKIMVAGSFTNSGGPSRSGIVRLMPDGSIDPSFDASATTGQSGFRAFGATELPGGDILVAYGLQAINLAYFARLGADGVRKASLFDRQSAIITFAPSPPLILFQPMTDGGILACVAGGRIGSEGRRLAWFEADGSLGSSGPLVLRQTFLSQEAGAAAMLRARAVGRYRIERSGDLRNWTSDERLLQPGLHPLEISGDGSEGFLRATWLGQ